MAEPISVTAVSAACASAASTGAAAGATSAGTAACSGAGAGATAGACASAGASAGGGAGAGAGSAAVSGSGAATVATAPSLGGLAARSSPAGIVQAPVQTEVFPEVRIEVTRPVAPSASSPGERANAADATTPAPAAPSPTDRSLRDKETRPDPVQSPTPESRAGREERPLDRMHPKPQGEPLDPKDPHDRERQRLNELLPRFPELSPREQRRAEEDLALWEFREKQKHPNMTLVIGEDGMGPSDWYQEHHKQKEQERYLDGLMRVGDAIANNPFAGGVALYVLERTGDPDQAANASESLLGLTGGGGRGRGKMAAMTPKRPPRPSYRKGFNRGTASLKPPPGRATASPPKLTPSQKRLRDHARRYRESLPKVRGDKYVTVAIAVVEKNGVRETWVVTNTHYMPKEIANAKMPSHILMPGTKGPAGNKDRPPADRVSYHHAEHHAVHIALSNPGYKVIELYPSRPACPDCAGFRAMGITVIDP